MSYFSNFDAVLAAGAAINGCPVNKNSLIYRESGDATTEYYVFQATVKAIEESRSRFPNESETSVQGAFRNGYWNALLIDIFGESNATIAATTYQNNITDYEALRLEMDLINNQKGRKFAKGIYFSDYSHCINLIANAVSSIETEFKVIVDDKLVPSSYVEKVYVISKSCAGVTRVRAEASFFSDIGYGWVPYGEVVLDLGKEGPFTKVQYYTSSQPNGKIGYIYTKYLQSLEIRYQPITTDSNGVQWYNPYSDGYKMTQAFNDLDTGLQGHLGHDIVKDGSPPIKAIADGEVVFVKNTNSKSGNGTMVQIKHTIKGKVLYSFYSHMVYNSLTVNTTDKKNVVAGQELGTMGSTGNSSGKHLHLGIYTGPYKESPSGYYKWINIEDQHHIIDFDEEINNSENRKKARQNALLVKGSKHNDSTRIFYDFLEVIKSGASIIN